MKFKVTKNCVIGVLVLFLGSACSSMGSKYSRNQFWPALKADRIEGTLWMAPVEVDKAGPWSSVENEAAGLLPLLFLEHKFAVLRERSGADYAVEVVLREREFSKGWETQASLSVEVRIWPGKPEAEEMKRAYPLAAGRALLQGSQSFSSSKTLNFLLREAVKKALWALAEQKKTAKAG